MAGQRERSSGGRASEQPCGRTIGQVAGRILEADLRKFHLRFELWNFLMSQKVSTCYFGARLERGVAGLGRALGKDER